MFKILTKLPKRTLPTSFRQSISPSNRNLTYFPLYNISIWSSLVKTPISQHRMKKVTEDMQYNFFSIAKFITEDNPVIIKRNLLKEEIEEQEKLAFKCFSLGEYQKALEMRKAMLYSARQVYDNDDSLIGEILKKIGDIFFEIREYDHAINNYEESLEVMRNSLGDKDSRVGRGYFILANCYRAQGMFEESIDYVNRALRVYLDVYGEGKYETVIASCYNTLADDYMHMGKYKEALTNYHKLFGQLKTLYKDDVVYKNDDIYMSQYYLNYGTALAKGAGLYEEGLRYLRRFVNSQLEFNHVETMDTALCYLRIGEIKEQQGKHNEALNMCEKAVEASKEVGGKGCKQAEMCEKVLEEVRLGHMGK